MKTWLQTLIIVTTIASLNKSCNVFAPEISTPTPFSMSALTATAPSTKVIPTTTSTPISWDDLPCWSVKPLQEGNNIKGSFVYANYSNNSENKENHLFAWEINSFRSEKLNVNGDNSIYRSVSFNGDTLLMVTEKELVFISHGRTQVIPLSEEAATKYPVIISSYLPDGRVLLITGYWPDSAYKEGAGFTDTYYIFDPKTNKITTYKLFLPNLYMDWRMVPNITYSPDMKYVIYESTPIIKGNDIVKQQYTLFDIQNNKILWVTPPQNTNLHVYGRGPQWVPNTNLITAQYYDDSAQSSNYYFISLDGKISPLNDLTNSPGDAEILHDPSLAWSPNGRYLVSADTQYIYIWDNQTKTWNKSCPNQFQFIDSPALVWSSDGNYFSVVLGLTSTTPSTVTSSGGIIPSKFIFKRYIFDLANKVIYEMPDENSGEFTPLYKRGNNQFLGWVNWEIP